MSTLEMDKTGCLDLGSPRGPSLEGLCSPWPLCAGLSACCLYSFYSAEERHLHH